MLRFERANETWWRKPLVRFEGRVLPAELAVLTSELDADETGAWLNSRGTQTGVFDFRHVGQGRYRTKRAGLPIFVSECLISLYRIANVTKGAPDLVIWKAATRSLRFVEVKCPIWDAPSPEQIRFMWTAYGRGIPASVREWVFADAARIERPTPAPASGPARSGRSPRTR